VKKGMILQERATKVEEFFRRKVPLGTLNFLRVEDVPQNGRVIGKKSTDPRTQRGRHDL